MHRVKDIRFLFGDPGSVGEVDPNDSKSLQDDDGKIRHSRYSRLLEEVIQEGPQTKVLMLLCLNARGDDRST